MAHAEKEDSDCGVNNDIGQKKGRDILKNSFVRRGLENPLYATSGDDVEPVRKEEIVKEDDENRCLHEEPDIALHQPDPIKLLLRLRHSEVEQLGQFSEELPL